MVPMLGRGRTISSVSKGLHMLRADCPEIFTPTVLQVHPISASLIFEGTVRVRGNCEQVVHLYEV